MRILVLDCLFKGVSNLCGLLFWYRLVTFGGLGRFSLVENALSSHVSVKTYLLLEVTKKANPKKAEKEGEWQLETFVFWHSSESLSVSTTLSTQSQSNFFEVTSFCHKFEQKKTQLDLIIISLKGNFLSVLSIYLPPYEDKVKNTRSVF